MFCLNVWILKNEIERSYPSIWNAMESDGRIGILDYMFLNHSIPSQSTKIGGTKRKLK